MFIFNRYIEAIGYNKLKLPGQKYIQHHEVKYPNHIGHLGQTITNHTWVLHEEPLEHDQNSLCYQEFQLMVTVHRADKIFLTQPKNENRTRTLMIGNRHIKSSTIVSPLSYSASHIDELFTIQSIIKLS